jgi:hypothetical protein
LVRPSLSDYVPKYTYKYTYKMGKIAARDFDAMSDPEDDDGVGWFVASPALMIPDLDVKA